jgi:hypothetical protein
MPTPAVNPQPVKLQGDTMTRNSRLLLLSTLVISAACTGELSTDPHQFQANPSASRSIVSRPAGGTCYIDGQFIAPAAGTVATFHATGVCNLKVLGRTTIVIDEWFLADGSVNNATTHVAANGDVLRSTWYSAPGQTVTTGSTAAFSGIETYNSGTGRFANVSGSSQVDGSAALNPNGSFTASYQSSGLISF